MRWDGQAYAEDIKYGLQKLLSDEDRENARIMSHIEFTSSFQKHCGDKLECFSRFPGSGSIVMRCDSDSVIFDFQRPIDDSGETAIELSWSMAARHIRAWEYEKRSLELQQESKPKSRMQEQWDNTHLCGSKYFGTLCEYFLQPSNSEDTVINGKKLDKLDRYSYYCTAENKVRKIGGGGSWTGLSPKFCPKRKALEKPQSMCNTCANNDGSRLKPHEGECIRYTSAEESAVYESEKEEGNEMARKMQFDAAITKDMKSAASDSFMDNIKMIDISEIEPSRNNFYEISDIELLADDIEREGLKHNLVVVKNPETGLYEVKSGHRRLAAIKLLIDEKRQTSTKIPCYVDGEKTAAESQFDLIMLNATQRKYSDADVLHEYEEIERTLKALESEGKPLKGRIRDNIAEILKVSPAQVGKIENIKHNAIPEVEKAVKSGEMSISTANEVAKLPEEKQQEIIKETPKISHKEVKEIQQQEKPAPKPAVKPNKNPIPEIDDDDFEDVDEISEDSTAEKESTVRVTFFLSADEAKSLVEFLDANFVSGCDDAKIGEILSRLESMVDGF